MYAIGWRPPQLGDFTIGRYINSTSISNNPELHNSLSLQLSQLQNITQNLFQTLSSTVFHMNSNQMKQFNIPGFEILDFTDFYSSSFANQLTFTSNNFLNFLILIKHTLQNHSINTDLTGKELGIVQMVWKAKSTRYFTLYPDGGDSNSFTRLSKLLQISKKAYNLFKNSHNGKVDNFTVDDHTSIINRLALTSK
ncbi:hypothetical protein O181_103589 [Austropuccinia psidii MF-1]|uniref:Tet-like 2OG-Fe(II) oxygenase domain-containing protein n=1 Tax=Austropuccinia psidii MF-1 TaxID=1389203 RepID=A0A9Q3JLI2_9BASI|nr:hypothetical protein [Austropuccinia psidii MF-1]